MRVPVYQQQVTPQIPSVRSQVSVPDGAAGVAVKPIDTTTGIAQGVESLRLGLVKMQENRDKFMLASAVNEYRRSNTQFLHAKDTGVFAKKGKDVFGISQQYDEFSSKTMEDIAKRYKMSGAARDRFVEATSALYNASLSSVMTHEQRETDAAQQQEWKAMASDTLSNIALCYADDNAFNENVQFGLSAISQQWEPYGDQVRDSKMREYLSQCQVQRVAAMLEESPKAASAYLEKHKGDFAGDDYLKVKKAVDNKLDVIKVQETTDVLVQKFRGNEQAALKWIHKNYEGDMENKMISSVKSRFAEADIKANRAAASLTAQQNNIYKTYRQAIDAGQFFDADALVATGMRPDQVSALLGKQESKRRRGNIERGLRAIDPAFDARPLEEKEAMIRRKAGISDAAHRDALVATYDQYVAGEIDDGTIKDRVDHGLLSELEGKQIKDSVKDLDAAQKTFVSMETKRLNAVLKGYAKQNDAFDTDEAAQQFADRVRAIPANAKDYRAQVKDAGRDVLVEMIDNSGVRLNGRLWGRTAVGEARDELSAKDYSKTAEYRMKEPTAVRAARSGQTATLSQPIVSQKKEEAKKAFKAGLPQAKLKQPASKEG